MRTVYWSGASARKRDQHTLEHSEQVLESIMEKQVAEKTLKNRKNLWQRFRWWTTTQQTQENANSAVLFLCGLDIEASTMRTYCTDLQMVGSNTYSDWDHHQLQLLSKTYRQYKPIEEINQAVPATLTQIWHSYRRALEENKVEIGILTLTLWKGAFRFSDMSHLLIEDVLHRTENEVILDLKKAKGGLMFSERRYSCPLGRAVPEISSWIHTRTSAANRKDPLFTTTSQQLLNFWARDPQTQTLSLHSPRRGALQQLTRMANQGYNIGPECIRKTARHKGNQELSTTTLRYLSNLKVEVAKLVTEGTATKYL